MVVEDNDKISGAVGDGVVRGISQGEQTIWSLAKGEVTSINL